MAKDKTQFICQQCGAVFGKWAGKCEACSEWNSLVEQLPVNFGSKAATSGISKGRELKATKVANSSDDSKTVRLKTGISDLDDLLGGGFLLGGVALVAGQPGIGKSTLLAQVASFIGAGHSVLYVSGEESVSQVGMRVRRLGLDSSAGLDLVSSNSTEDIVSTIISSKYQLVIVDSVQTLNLSQINSSPGSVSQITNSANVIIRAAKESGTTVILVGHVTKEGSIAGPKVLEHLVDTVLNFDGDRYGGFRMVRSQKNRFGSTSELVIFEMTEKGLKVVTNPSASLLAERQNNDGSIILATMDGTRPLLVEIQALVNNTSFGYPKRTASGFDLNRLNLLVAVLEKRTKLKLSDKDIFINVVGGLKIDDPSADLAVAMAIASAGAGKSLSDDAVVFGEVGLGGEVRSAIGWQQRIKEAKKLGFKFAIAPQTHNNSFVSGVVDLRQALIKYLQ